MRIAVHLNDRQEPCDFFESGRVCVFEGDHSDWVLCTEFALQVTQQLTLHEMKQVFLHKMEDVRECKDFIVHEQRGIFRVFLEDLGFRVWESTDKQIAEQLNEVACLQACTPDSCEPCLYPKPVGDPAAGVYRVNLIELMSQGVPLVSREILIPFLETMPFARLEVICDHAPRWFAQELSSLGAKIRSDDPINDRLDRMIVLAPDKGERTCPKGRSRRSCGCNCGG